MNLIPRRSVFDIDNFFDDFLAPAQRQAGANFFSPRVDVKDNKDHVEISAELPGVKKEDIDVTLENGVLTLTAESRHEEKEEKEGRTIRQERRYGKYMRSFDLGSGVKEKDIKAHFENGVLTLKAPKAEEKKQEARRIQIQ
ncbi:Hsp20/alpha crystallin family protein [Proteobacteria bacterium 005FR1]|nr:Hsp20/alpha crystallin family protein [Proteobacteria bacterium 005FR1]